MRRATGPGECFDQEDLYDICSCWCRDGGFVISVKEKDINLEPSSKMDAFLKEQEYLYLSQGLQPYDGKLIKKEDENWYIKI